MGEVIYVSNVSTSWVVAVNALWGVLLEGHPCPSRVYLLHNPKVKGQLDKALKALNLLLRDFGCRFNVIPMDSYDDPKKYRASLRQVILEWEQDGLSIDRVYFDVTAGRKFMAMAVLSILLDATTGRDSDVARVFGSVKDVYLVILYLKEYSRWYGRDALYWEIPLLAQELIITKLMGGSNE